jgi:hypothetical protein
LIPGNEDSDIEAGRIEDTGEDRDDDTLTSKTNNIITDSENDTESEDRREAVQKAASTKQVRINWETRNLDYSFNPTLMEKPMVIETDNKGKEEAKQVHFVFLALDQITKFPRV